MWLTFSISSSKGGKKVTGITKYDIFSRHHLHVHGRWLPQTGKAPGSWGRTCRGSLCYFRILHGNRKKNTAGVAFSDKEQWRAARREGFKLLIANFVASTRHLVKNICKANRSTWQLMDKVLKSVLAGNTNTQCHGEKHVEPSRCEVGARPRRSHILMQQSKSV